MSLDNPFLLGVSMHLQGNDDGVGFGVKGTSLNNTGVLGTSNNRAGVFSSSIGARWLKRLHHFTRLSALLTIVLVVAGAKAQPFLPAAARREGAHGATKVIKQANDRAFSGV